MIPTGSETGSERSVKAKKSFRGIVGESEREFLQFVGLAFIRTVNVMM
jgi:hypothetical protein